MLDTIRRWQKEAAQEAASPPCLLIETDLREAEAGLHQLLKTLTGLLIGMTREIGTRGLMLEDGHRDTAHRLRDQYLMDPVPAAKLAHAIDTLNTRPRVQQALLEGRIDVAQATVITDTVNQIPATVAGFPGVAVGQVADQAETLLLDNATRLNAQRLRKLADRILTHVAPDIAERAEEEALRRAEAKAARKRGFTMSAPVDGMVHLSGRLGVEDAATVSAALHPLCQPAPRDDRSAEQKRADALVEVCALTLRGDNLPADGGEPPQLAVSVKYDTLTGQLGTGLLPDGERITPETVRRLACDARILPFVLGGQSQILDAGRSRRTATGPLRRALTVRDRGCAHPDCDRPARWCDVVLPRFHGQMLADSA